MGEYVFVCIGTNKLVADSFGPRVGQRLQANFGNFSKVQVFGTMQNPIHFKNAKILANRLKNENKKQIILVDSCFSRKEEIGSTFANLGGVEIGKAYGKSFYFPAHINIKTVIGNQTKIPNWNISQIDDLAQRVANQITNVVWQI